MKYLEKKLEGYTKKAAELKEKISMVGVELDSDDIYKAVSEIDACNFIIDSLKVALKAPVEPLQAFAIYVVAKEVENKYFEMLTNITDKFEEEGKTDKEMLGKLTVLNTSYNEMAKIVNGMVEAVEEERVSL